MSTKAALKDAERVAAVLEAAALLQFSRAQYPTGNWKLLPEALTILALTKEHDVAEVNAHFSAKWKMDNHFEYHVTDWNNFPFEDQVRLSVRRILLEYGRQQGVFYTSSWGVPGLDQDEDVAEVARGLHARVKDIAADFIALIIKLVGPSYIDLAQFGPNYKPYGTVQTPGQAVGDRIIAGLLGLAEPAEEKSSKPSYIRRRVSQQPLVAAHGRVMPDVTDPNSRRYLLERVFCPTIRFAMNPKLLKGTAPEALALGDESLIISDLEVLFEVARCAVETWSPVTGPDKLALEDRFFELTTGIDSRPSEALALDF
jgi:hypothetical protein